MGACRLCPCQELPQEAAVPKFRRPKKQLTVRDLSELARVSKRTIQRDITRGRLRVTHVNRRVVRVSGNEARRYCACRCAARDDLLTFVDVAHAMHFDSAKMGRAVVKQFNIPIIRVNARRVYVAWSELKRRVPYASFERVHRLKRRPDPGP